MTQTRQDTEQAALSTHSMVEVLTGKDATQKMSHLPVPMQDFGNSNSLSNYLYHINQYPMLKEDEEKNLVIDLRDEGDLQAAHKLVTSHLRLVAKIAFGYRGYGLPLADLVSEGNVGLLQAVKNYKLDKGARLSTYAMWWIKAAIYEYILKSWSLVKIGTTSAQKKLFFNLRRLKAKLEIDGESHFLSDQQVKQIAGELKVSETDVRQMEVRMGSADQSLNSKIFQDDGYSEDWQSRVVDTKPNPEETLMDTDEKSYQKKLLYNALNALKPREREILIERKLDEKPKTLEELSKHYGISRERIRQLEVQAMNNLQKIILQQNSDIKLLA